jgi:hypothetical protein
VAKFVFRLAAVEKLKEAAHEAAIAELAAANGALSAAERQAVTARQVASAASAHAGTVPPTETLTALATARAAWQSHALAVADCVVKQQLVDVAADVVVAARAELEAVVKLRTAARARFDHEQETKLMAETTQLSSLRDATRATDVVLVASAV